MNDEVMKAQQAADYLKVCLKTLYKLVKENRIKYTRAGNRYRFLKSELDKYLRGETLK